MAHAGPTTVPLEGGSVDLTTRRARVGGVDHELTPTEAALLSFLVSAQGEVVPRATLLREVWGYREGVQSRTLDTTIRRLRAKVERRPETPRHLLTEVGVGYRFAPVAEEDQARGAIEDLDPFVGRQEEWARLDHLARAGAQLVTLVGPGGAGKTRLAGRWVRARGGRIVELGARTRPEELLGAVARALGHAGPADAAALGASLARAAVEAPFWLLLDNVEQLLPTAAGIVRDLAGRAGRAGVLVTSRERLRVPGETVVEVGPLRPEEAIALLRLRAPSTLGEAPEQELASLAARLDGLPLAIELAAGRADLLGVEELILRLDQPLQVLTSVRGGGRHQSMRQVLRSSWQLLTPRQRLALVGLGIFQGGFTVAAAAAVLDEPDAMDLLQSLRDRSWARVHPGSEGHRLALPHLALAWARQEGPAETEAGQQAAHQAADRHAAWFARAGEDGARDALELGDGRARRALEAEWENLRAAADHATRQGQADLAARCCLAAYEAGRLGRPGAEVLARVRPTLGLPGLSEGLRVRLLLVLAAADRARGASREAFAAAAEARERARALGDRRQEALAAMTSAILFQERGDLDAALHHHEEALRLAQAEGAERTEATVRSNLGNLCEARGQAQEAREHHEAAVALHRRLGTTRLLAVALGNLAIARHEVGEVDGAEDGYQEALELHRQVGSRRYVGQILGNMGMLAMDRGDLDVARERFAQAVEIHRELGSLRDEGVALVSLGELHRRRGDLALAIPAAQAALDCSLKTRFRLLQHVTQALLGELLAAGPQAAGPQVASANAGSEDGLARIVEAEAGLVEAGAEVERAIATCRRGRVLAARGLRAQARAALAQAQTVAQAQRVGPRSELGHHLAELSARCAPASGRAR